MSAPRDTDRGVPGAMAADAANYVGALREHEPMARHSTWRAGGPARRYFEPASLADLQTFMHEGLGDDDALLVGAGSNLLVRDGGFDGVVIATQKLDAFVELEPGTFRVEAGVACARVAKSTAQSGYRGAEFMIGIPGSIGGALAMNAGAYGSETWQLVTAVETLSRSGELRQRAPAEFEVGYRQVKGLDGEWFVAACLRLEAAGEEDTVARVAELLEHRASTQPVGRPSCGSVFRNPPGQHAAALIERCGLKGHRIGGCHVSEKHANFILNEDGASAADIEAMIEHVRAVVQDRCGVALIAEVHIVGDPGEAS